MNADTVRDLLILAAATVALLTAAAVHDHLATRPRKDQP